MQPQRRRTRTLLTYQLGLWNAATIIYLEDRETSCGTHRFSEPVETRQMSIMCRTDFPPRAPVLFDVSRGRNGSSESAGSTSSDKFEFVFGSRPIFIGRIGCQRSDCKPIYHLSRPLLNLKGDQTTIDQTSDILKLGGIEWKPVRCNSIKRAQKRT